jgi:hypothetical protein
MRYEPSEEEVEALRQVRFVPVCPGSGTLVERGAMATACPVCDEEERDGDRIGAHPTAEWASEAKKKADQ